MTNPTADALLQQAQALIKAGRRVDARKILESLVNQDDQNEMGWLFLSACVDSLSEQKICLENVLMLNPNNMKAQKGLEVVKQKLGASAPKAAPPSPTSSAPAQPAPSPYDFGSPYDSGVVNMGSGSYSTASSSADLWSSSDQAYEEPTASSVDWGKGSAPAYGSGQNVPQPSAKEFDSWVAKLPLGGKAKEPEQPQTRAPQTMRTTADMPPIDVEATEEQFNIPSAYDRDDDPFRASFDFTDGTGFAAQAAPKSVSPFDMADLGGDLGTANFDFSGGGDFGGPFSANTGSSAAAAPAEPDYGYNPNSSATTDSNMFKFDTGSFGAHSQSQSQEQAYASPSYGQSYDQGYDQSYEQSSSSFKVPGGYSDPSVEDSGSYAGSSYGSTSADRFKFNSAPLETGVSASKGSRRGIEMPGSSGLFRDNPLDSNPDLGATITEFSDDELAGASGVFGMATRKADSRAKRPDNFAAASNAGMSTAGSAVVSSGAFRLIPPEIKAPGGKRGARGSGGKVSVRTLIAVIVLLILNVLSIAVLIFFNLRGMGIV